MAENEGEREVEPWRAVRLQCAIGHQYRGEVRTVSRLRQQFHADQQAWSDPLTEYRPPTCVVCGLQTYKVIDG